VNRRADTNAAAAAAAATPTVWLRGVEASNGALARHRRCH